MFVPLERAEPGLTLADVGLTPPALLAREAAWGAPSVVPAIDSFRRRAMDDVTDDWFRTLNAIAPRAVVIWNGHHVIEMILDAVSRLGGVPTLYVERAPIPQALFADERGLSAESEVAHRKSWTVPDDRWRERADAVVRWLTAGAQTWWTQPASRGGEGDGLRRQLGIPDGARVVLFAAQVDQDTQQFLLSPHFESNLSAFAWLLDELRGRDDVFVLGKHHPKSRTDPGCVSARARRERRRRRLADRPFDRRCAGGRRSRRRGELDGAVRSPRARETGAGDGGVAARRSRRRLGDPRSRARSRSGRRVARGW